MAPSAIPDGSNGTDPVTAKDVTRRSGLLRNLGPGLITAAVVIGPGTITITSKIGAAAGMNLLWVLVSTSAFMMVFTAMSARIGILNQDSILSLVSRHYGRWLSILIGCLAFAVCAGFQSSNYLACSSALESMAGGSGMLWMIIVGAAGVVFVFVARRLYLLLEKVMTILVAVMLVAFLVNLIIARPHLTDLLSGLVPRGWPTELTGLMIGLSATTFSVIAALYQSALARQKGWERDDLGTGVKEAVVGISALFGVSLMIMWTAATVLQGATVDNAAALSEQLKPSLGSASVWMFGAGFLAAGFSSTVINAMIGGALLADGFGLDSRLNNPPARWLTTAAMAVGLAAAFYLTRSGTPLGGIVVAQKSTILTVPLVAVVMIVMANDRRIVGDHRNPVWQNVLAGLAVVALVLMSLYRLREMFE